MSESAITQTKRDITLAATRAKSLRGAACVEQASAEAEGKTELGWAYASVAADYRRQAQEQEDLLETLVAQREDRVEAEMANAIDAMRAVAELSDCSIEDAIDAMRQQAITEAAID